MLLYALQDVILERKKKTKKIDLSQLKVATKSKSRLQQVRCSRSGRIREKSRLSKPTHGRLSCSNTTPIHPPSQKSFVSWPTGIHCITCMPHDTNRQVLADLPHPPSHLQYALPTTSAVQVTYAACIHRCQIWFSRCALPQNPW